MSSVLSPPPPSPGFGSGASFDGKEAELPVRPEFKESDSVGSVPSLALPSMDVLPPSLPPAAAPMVQCPPSYVWTNRSTHSDVLATTVTTRVVPAGGVRRIRGGTTSSAYQLRLPYAHATPPMPPSMSLSKRNKALIRERDEFMAALRLERETREAEEYHAAVEIQKSWRGYAVRLPMLQERRRRAPRVLEDESEEELRRELERLRAATAAKIAAGEEDDDVPEWRRQLRKREAAKEAKKKRRALQLAAAVRIQSRIRGYLARVGMRIVFQLRREEKGVLAIVKLQAVVRGFLLRAALRHEVEMVQAKAIVIIQNAARQALARSRMNFLRDHMQELLKRDNALVNIQRTWRGHIARTRARRYQEARAALPVQAVWRGFLARRLVTGIKTETTEAATRIQAIQRARLARSELELRRKEMALEKAAADRRNRIRLAKEREAAAAAELERIAAEQAAAEAAEAERKRKEAEEAAAAAKLARLREEAAVRIQSSVRSKAARNKVAAMRKQRLEELAAEAAAEEEEAAARAAAHRETERKRREAEAAAKAEEERIMRESASVKIQRLGRGHINRRRVNAMRRKRLEDLEAEALAAAPRRRVRRGASKASFASSASGKEDF